MVWVSDLIKCFKYLQIGYCNFIEKYFWNQNSTQKQE